MARKFGERCTPCGRVFTTTGNGDRHRKVVEVYDIWRTPAGLVRVVQTHPTRSEADNDYLTAQKLAGNTLLSRGNQVRECVDPATVGLVQNKHGLWHTPPGPRHWENKE